MKKLLAGLALAAVLTACGSAGNSSTGTTEEPRHGPRAGPSESPSEAPSKAPNCIDASDAEEDLLVAHSVLQKAIVDMSAGDVDAAVQDLRDASEMLDFVARDTADSLSIHTSMAFASQDLLWAAAHVEAGDWPAAKLHIRSAKGAIRMAPRAIRAARAC